MSFYYRVCVWDPAETNPAVNGHPLHVWPHQGPGRVDDVDGDYRVLYVGDTAAGAIAEYLGNYAQWTPDVLVPPPAAPVNSRIAIARYAGDLPILDLDDPYVLTEWGLRSSSVVTRDRSVTQTWARHIYDASLYAGVAWWSYRDPRWASYGLWDISSLTVAGEPELLTLDHRALLEASRVINRLIIG